MCRRVETDYREAPDEAERLKKVARLLSEGVLGYLKRKGLLAPQEAHVAENDAPEAHRPGGDDAP